MLKPETVKPVHIARHIISGMDTTGDADANQTFTRVVDRLVKDHDFPMDAARDAAAIGIAEQESQSLGAWIDLDASTPACVFIVKDGQRMAVSVGHILNSLEM